MKNLIISHLRFRYQEDYILDGLDLTIKAGEILVLLGQSGSGKSSLLKILLGILIPTEGNILLENQDITYLPPQKRNMGYVPQAQVLFPHMTVKENIMFGLKLRKFPEKMLDHYQKVLQITDLTTLEKRYPHELSGGQQQRVALARALVISPDFLLLDEPLSSIDATGREELALMIRLIQQEMNTTIVYVTHNHEEARLLADRIAVLFDGKIQQLGPTPVVYSNPINFRVAQILGKENIWPIISQTKVEGKILFRTSLGEINFNPFEDHGKIFTGIELPLKIYSLNKFISNSGKNNDKTALNTEKLPNSEFSETDGVEFICKINAVVDLGSKNYKVILRIWPQQVEIVKILCTLQELNNLNPKDLYRLKIPWKDFKAF